MEQLRTHNCGELTIADVGRQVRLAGWLENTREVGASLTFAVLRDFYGTTQIVVEDEAMMAYQNGLVDMHDPIKVWKELEIDGEKQHRIIDAVTLKLHWIIFH